MTIMQPPVSVRVSVTKKQHHDLGDGDPLWVSESSLSSVSVTDFLDPLHPWGGGGDSPSRPNHQRGADAADGADRRTGFDGTRSASMLTTSRRSSLNASHHSDLAPSRPRRRNSPSHIASSPVLSGGDTVPSPPSRQASNNLEHHQPNKHDQQDGTSTTCCSILSTASDSAPVLPTRSLSPFVARMAMTTKDRRTRLLLR